MNESAMELIEQLDSRTKPLGSLGQLEQIAAQMVPLRDGALHGVDRGAFGSTHVFKRSVPCP
jgi:hypothetical protein